MKSKFNLLVPVLLAPPATREAVDRSGIPQAYVLHDTTTREAKLCILEKMIRVQAQEDGADERSANAPPPPSSTTLLHQQQPRGAQLPSEEA
ncbi:hypothetical protein EYF80_026541 [Liparis tanakae]|uniref:Uncharacterized protein n=1 Tax=Liparis tanakae TaxID=230148 RepID=A0A4Z2HCQ4_9TELE|nr:hypothetical protein EYF80_026541 [Liparis tanakae]